MPDPRDAMTDLSIQPAAGALDSFAATDKTRAFLAAARHSARVRRLRFLMIGGALALVGGIVAVALFDPFHHELPGVAIEGASLNGTEITMANPRLSGFHKDGRPFTITASSAVQDIKSPTLFQLHDLQAQLTMGDQTITRMTAASGRYNSTTEIMDLTSEVRITGGSGLDVRAADAQVSLKTSGVVTRKPVTVAMRGSTVDADGMEVADSGHRVTFEGHVHSVIRPSEGEATPAPAAGSADATP